MNKKRLETESFEDYKERLSEHALGLKKWSKGIVFWDSSKGTYRNPKKAGK